LEDDVALVRSNCHKSPPSWRSLFAAVECIRLRIQDVDFGQNIIYFRGGNGEKYRTTMLPKNLRDEMLRQIAAMKSLHYWDLEEGFGNVYIPDALARKFPKASK
jgi:integrase